MFQWRPATRLPAILATTLVVLTAGCSHLGSNADGDEDDEDSVEFVELDPAITKLDEAAIGVSGPEQIEEAIEALDNQNGNGPRLVRELGQDGAPLPEAGDLFERIRKGYTISDIDHPSVDVELRWFVNHPDYLDRTFKRGERYLHFIVGELEARNMPLELALLPVVESAFNPVAFSRARASGLWQFIAETGRRYGLKQNWYYDGRRDVVASTSAALDYLQFLHDEFDGDWLLAVAAYNCGEARVAREVEKNLRAGKPADYFSLKLPRETKAYVPKLLAMRRIVGDPTSHGLAFAPIPNSPYFVKVDVGGQLDLHVAAELADLSKEEILALNPAFNHWITDPEGPHQILVPLDRNDRFKEGIAALPPTERVRVVYHRVRRGDTLGGIADKYGLSVAAIKSANKIRGSMIHPGQELLIAAAPKGVQLPSETQLASYEEEAPARSRGPADKHVVRRGDTLWSIAKTYGVSMDRLANTNGLDSDGTLSVGQRLSIPGTARLATTDSSSVSRSTTYVVRRGDSLSTIATKFRVRLTDLLGWNNLTKRSVIKPGQRLVMYVDDRRRAGI
jgi:membrane-bound lytic murein transglycosylase D